MRAKNNQWLFLRAPYGLHLQLSFPFFIISLDKKKGEFFLCMEENMGDPSNDNCD